jgi:uncharacterized SAM-binding protein YcdF (DUF218 family)
MVGLQMPSLLAFDAILIHAAPVPDHDNLGPHASARLERGARLFHEQGAEAILLTAGNADWFNFAPHGIERLGRSDGFTSRAKAYLEHLGVPAERIRSCKLGRDTVGEYYAAKKGFMEPEGWTRLAAVSNEFHGPRCLLIAKTLLGPAYEIVFYGVTTAWDHPPYREEQMKGEATSSRIFMEQFGDIGPNDDAKVERAFASKHNLYRNLPETEQIRFLGLD